jgi:hypothetical protein
MSDRWYRCIDSLLSTADDGVPPLPAGSVLVAPSAQRALQDQLHEVSWPWSVWSVAPAHPPVQGITGGSLASIHSWEHECSPAQWYGTEGARIHDLLTLYAGWLNDPVWRAALTTTTTPVQALRHEHAWYGLLCERVVLSVLPALSLPADMDSFVGHLASGLAGLSGQLPAEETAGAIAVVVNAAVAIDRLSLLLG